MKISLNLGGLFLFVIAGCAQPVSPPATTAASELAPQQSGLPQEAIATTDSAVPAIPAEKIEKVDVPADVPEGTATTSSTTDTAATTDSANLKAEPLDLTYYYHSSADGFDRDGGHPWRDVPRGKQTFGNVPLEIGGRMTLWGSINAGRGHNNPEYVTDVQIDRKFEALYLYHATFHSAPQGTPIARLTFHYVSGDPTTADICYGTHVRDWFVRTGEPEELSDPKSKRVWRGKNSMSKSNPPGELQFFITEIANPHPKDEVTTIDFASTKEQPNACIMAITTGPAGLLKIEP